MIGVIGIARDITEHNEAEQALRESEARFRGVFESRMIGTLFWNVQGKITDANDSFLQMVGYPRDDVLSGKIGWRDMTPPEYRERGDRALQEIIATGAITPFEQECIRADGSRIPIMLGAASLPGPTLNGVAFVLDITERKRAEAALRENQERMDLALRGADLGTWDWNVQTGAVAFNERWGRDAGMHRRRN